MGEPATLHYFSANRIARKRDEVSSLQLGMLFGLGALLGLAIGPTINAYADAAGGEIIEDVRRVTGDLEGVRSVDVELVWDPYWTPERMDPRVRAFLGF